MGDGYRTFTPFKKQLSEPANNNSLTNINLDGLSSIESSATARQAKNEERKAINKNNDISDTAWLGSAPTSLRDVLANKTSSQSIATSTTRTDEYLFQRQHQPVAIVNMKAVTQPASISLPVTSVKSMHPIEVPGNPKIGLSRAPNQGYKISRDKEYWKFFLQVAFRDNFTLALIKQFSVEVKIIDTRDEPSGTPIGYTIMLSGSQVEVTRALDALELLFTMAFQKKIFEKNQGFWTCKPEAVHLVQTYANHNGIKCLCDVKVEVGMIIYYFSSTMTSLKSICTTDAAIDRMISDQFSLTSIQIPVDLDASMRDKYSNDLQNLCIQPSYKDKILITKEADYFLIFGLVDAVNRLKSVHENSKQTLTMGQVQLDFHDYQIEFLLNIYQDELKQLEQQNKGLQLLTNISGGYFTGPKRSHDMVRQKLLQMVQTCQQNNLNIDDIRFSHIAKNSEQYLLELGAKHKCLVKSRSEMTEKSYSTLTSSLEKGQTALAPAAMLIDIRVGDLATQYVDTVVVCSTSQYLMNDILTKAGAKVKKEVDEALSNGNITPKGYETAAGELFCRRLFFLPWTTQKLDNTHLRESIHAFFTAAIQHAVKNQQTSLAFPALGCGKLEYDPEIIAETILDETQRYANYNLKILIVLLPDKHKAYAAFCSKLANLRKKNTTARPTIFSHRYNMVTMTVTGAESSIQQYSEALQHYFNEQLLTEECGEFPLHVWNQSTIDTFYKYCFEHHVSPEVNSPNEILQLSGVKDNVMAAKVEFYRLKSMIAEEARIASFARIAVWVFEIDAGMVEKYSLKLNALIEEAFSHNQESVGFRNEHNEECVIQFKEKQEVCGGRQRRVMRKDFQLPSHWVHQSEDVIRCSLDTNDSEYIKVITQFDETMSGKYIQIQIERIQNQRWYTGYKTFRDYSKRKDTEQSLFHGCPETSADMIIYNGFNRSFAGVNGVVYGVGVYFSKKANYSHSFTRASPGTQRRCMFLTKVVVGKSTVGNENMRVAPDGYDSTTDGNHIFVTYHDDQAYAEYLITYTAN